jgi:ComF family protein
MIVFKGKNNILDKTRNPLSSFIDILYPPRCHICGKFLSYREAKFPLSYICSNCLRDMSPIRSPICSICGVPFSANRGDNHLCEDCTRKRPYYELARAPYVYSGKLKGAIQRFKYNSETHLGKPFGGLLLHFIQKMFHKMDEYIIIPVPLHKKKLRERGYNQSLLLAKILSKKLRLKLDYLSFIRIRYTQNQAGLRRIDRRKNVKDAFSVTDVKAIKAKKILLVDDVFTTGFTLNECAKSLKESGAAEIICVTLARTPFD